MNTNTTSIQSLTLQAAILKQVDEFAFSAQSFSIHDITRAIRDKVNSRQWSIPEAKSLVSADLHEYNIEHSTVKTTFEFLLNGQLNTAYNVNKTFNGQYFVYTMTPYKQAANPSINSNTTNVQQVTRSSPASINNSPVDNTEICRRIKLYMDRRTRPATLKQIQSAIKRGNQPLGLTMFQIEDLIIGTLQRTDYL